jgi:enamine deaminase RidA (YjgF/YER057c/UK114 family)
MAIESELHDGIEEIYVDENNNEISKAEYIQAGGNNAEETIEVLSGKICDDEYSEIIEEIPTRNEEQKHTFQDSMNTKGGDSIFKAKTNVDAFIKKGNVIKDKFIKEANLVETEEAEEMLNAAFEKIKELRTRKTGVLKWADKLLPSVASDFINKTTLKIEQEKRNNLDIVDTSNELFGLIKEKQENVEQAAYKFNDIKNQMKATLESLSEEAATLDALIKSEELDEMEIYNANRVINIISSNILIFRENIEQINASQNVAQQCIMHIDQMLPTIENSMKDSLAVNGFLNKINNLKDSFMTIADVTNQISENNSENINNIVRKASDFEELLESNVKNIENRTKNRKALKLEMQGQHQKQLALDSKIRDTIVSSMESMDEESKTPIFNDSEEVAKHFVPEKINLSGQLENKKTVRKVVKRVLKKTTKTDDSGEA